MKKRTVSIIVVMILLVTMLSGCGLFTLDTDRDGAQHIAKVNVDGMQGVVTKADLMGFFNQVGILYIQYYGWSAEKVIKELTTQLANKEILVLYATKHFAEKTPGVNMADVKRINNAYVENTLAKGTKDYKAGLRPYDLFNLFGNDEKLYIKKQANKSFETSYKELLKEVEDELAANAGDVEEEDKEEDKEEEEDKKELAPRTKRTLTPDNSFVADDSITKEDVDSLKTFFEDMDDKAANGKLTKVEREAYSRFTKNLEKNFDSVTYAWNNIIDGQKEARLIEKYREDVTNGVAVKEEEITSRYNYKLSQDILTVVDEASYKTAIEADKANELLVHNNKSGYFTVKSILLGFSDEQKEALKAIQGGITGSYDPAVIANEREKLAVDPTYNPYGVGNAVGGIKVNISNPNYDENAECEDPNCTCKECTKNPNYKKGDKCDKEFCDCVECKHNAYLAKKPVKEVLLDMANALENAGNNLDMSKVTLTADEQNAAKLNAKMDMFEDLIYLVNDDPGMFNSTGYVVNMEGESTYVAEYVALARALAKKNEIGAVGGLTATEGLDSNSTLVNPFDDKKPRIKVNEVKSSSGNTSLNYIVNDFGIHIVMVTYVNKEGTNTDKINPTDAERYRLTGDHVVKYANKYVLDDEGAYVYGDKVSETMNAYDVVINGKKELVELENKTVDERIEDTIRDEKKGVVYADEEKKINDKYKGKIERNTKLMDKIINDINKELKKAGAGHAGHNH